MSILVIIRYSRRDGNMNSQSKNEKFVNFPCPSLVEQHQYAPSSGLLFPALWQSAKIFLPSAAQFPGQSCYK